MIKNGFHLIELLIVIAIISILLSIALPQYSQHLIHARRLQAANTLEKLALALEQYYFRHQSYTDATLTSLGFPSVIADNHYALLIQTAETDVYQIAAIPISSQAKKDSCGTLILNATGERSVSGNEKFDKCF
jgi:type IV pilus assembly protein PilE